MTKEDIDNIIGIICPNDEDFEKPIISPAYLKKELETLAIEEEPSGRTMTREEAIEVLQQDIPCEQDTEFIEALEMAIKALKQRPCPYSTKDGYCQHNDIAETIPTEQEPSGDLISREDVEECKELMTDINGDTVYAVRMSYIRQLPSVNPQEPKIDGDCISKEKVIDILDYWYDSDSDGYIQAAKSINELPFVTPQEPKTGWIPVSERLPEPMQIVLICQKYKTNKYQPVTVAQFNGKYFMWYGYQKNWGKHTNICEHGDMCPGNEYVDAWMPLPEPYKESEG